VREKKGSFFLLWGRELCKTRFIFCPIQLCAKSISPAFITLIHGIPQILCLL
jgi:hypothetical protein